jgi:pimeloyl-ACP methyl ester carboxylesterase
MLQERFYEGNGVRLNYAEGPDNRPPLLLLPAYDNRWQSYASIVPELASKTHLYALDTRGRGRSDRTPGEYEIAYSLNDTIGFIEEIIGRPCHIFGHSNGGWVGLLLAASRPDLVSSLIVGDSALDVDYLIEVGKSEEEKEGNRKFMDWAGRPVEELVKVFSERYTDRPLSYVEMRALTFSQVDPEIYSDWVGGTLDKYFSGYNSRAVLEAIECPTLVLQAENGMISLDDVIWARSINGEIKVKQMAGMDHWLGIQDGMETAVLSEIINFLYSF